jgi:hypothetical protein
MDFVILPPTNNNQNGSSSVSRYLFATRFVVLHKPVDTLLDSLFHGDKLIVGSKRSQLDIGGRLFELSIGLGGIKDHISFKLHGLGNGKCDILDADFSTFINRQGNWFWLMIVSHDPHTQFCQVQRVDELTQGRSTSPNGKIGVVLLGQKALVNETRNDVTILNGKVVMWSINVGGDNGRKVASIFFRICSVHGINETFGIRVAFVRGVGWTVVKHGFVNGIGGLVGKDAGGEHTDKFFNLGDAAALHDVVVDQNVFAKKFDLAEVLGDVMCECDGCCLPTRFSHCEFDHCKMHIHILITVQLLTF